MVSDKKAKECNKDLWQFPICWRISLIIEAMADREHACPSKCHEALTRNPSEPFEIQGFFHFPLVSSLLSICFFHHIGIICEKNILILNKHLSTLLQWGFDRS